MNALSVIGPPSSSMCLVSKVQKYTREHDGDSLCQHACPFVSFACHPVADVLAGYPLSATRLDEPQATRAYKTRFVTRHAVTSGRRVSEGADRRRTHVLKTKRWKQTENFLKWSTTRCSGHPGYQRPEAQAAGVVRCEILTKKTLLLLSSLRASCHRHPRSSRNNTVIQHLPRWKTFLH